MRTWRCWDGRWRRRGRNALLRLRWRTPGSYPCRRENSMFSFAYVIVLAGAGIVVAVAVAAGLEYRDRRWKRERARQQRVREHLERHMRPMAIQVLPSMPTRPFEGGLSHDEKSLLRLVNTRSEWDDGSDGA